MTASIILTHVAVAIVLYVGFTLYFARLGDRRRRPCEAPSAGTVALEGIVTGAAPELVAPFSRRACVAWRIWTPDPEATWRNGPADWADEIVIRLDSGLDVRLAFIGATFVSKGQASVGPVEGPLDFGGRPGKIGHYDEWGGRVREEMIAMGDRVYVSGAFSSSSPEPDDPMRRQGTGQRPRRWSVSVPQGQPYARLHRGTFADFGAFGSESRRLYLSSIRLTVALYALYLGFAIPISCHPW